jgi:microcystin degradation protein MlrC
MKNVVTGSISHETNTFSNVPSTLDVFRRMGLYEGDDFFKAYENTKTVGGAFIDTSREKGFNLIPTIWNSSFAWGLVTEETREYLLGKVLEGIENTDRVDGVLMELHGAMVSEGVGSSEGYMLRRIREKVGTSVPIVATLDLHANISQLAVDMADVLVGYDTYPHVDSYERGREAGELIWRMMNDQIHPKHALEKPPMMPSPQKQKTNYFPMKAVYDLAHRIEEGERVLNVTVLPGFPFADIPEAGLSVIVTTDGDEDLARRKAKEISDFCWMNRKHFLADVVPVEEAVRRALSAKEGPIVLVDQADNPGGGAPCDGTVLLRELLKWKAGNVVVCPIRDPEAVDLAIKAGVGNTITMKVGGKTDDFNGGPIEVTGYVKLISDGKFRVKGPMDTGIVTNLGRTVVLKVDDVEIILTEIGVQPTDLQQYRAFGIEPTEKKIIVVKSSVHFRAVHEPIAKEIIEVDTPGIHGTRLSAFGYKKIRRPMFPIDPETLGISELRTSLKE